MVKRILLRRQRRLFASDLARGLRLHAGHVHFAPPAMLPQADANRHHRFGRMSGPFCAPARRSTSCSRSPPRDSGFSSARPDESRTHRDPLPSSHYRRRRKAEPLLTVRASAHSTTRRLPLRTVRSHGRRTDVITSFHLLLAPRCFTPQMFHVEHLDNCHALKLLTRYPSPRILRNSTSRRPQATAIIGR